MKYSTLKTVIFANYWGSPLVQFSKFKNFLWVCWFLCKKLSNFVPPAWKLHNPYCHTAHQILNGMLYRVNQFRVIWPRELWPKRTRLEGDTFLSVNERNWLSINTGTCLLLTVISTFAAFLFDSYFLYFCVSTVCQNWWYYSFVHFCSLDKAS